MFIYLVFAWISHFMIFFVEIKIPLIIHIKRILIVRQTLSTAYMNCDILVNVNQYDYDQIVIF